MTVVLAVVALLVALVTPPALAWNEPDGFRGVPWGTPRQEVGIQLQGAGDAVTCRGNIIGCIGPLTIGPVLVSAQFLFGMDKFEAVHLTFVPTEYAALRTIFEDRYGAPSSVKAQPIQNQMGAKFTNETALWVGERVTISLSRYGSKLDQGRAWIGLKAALDRHMEEFQKAIKKGKDEL